MLAIPMDAHKLTGQSDQIHSQTIQTTPCSKHTGIGIGIGITIDIAHDVHPSLSSATSPPPLDFSPLKQDHDAPPSASLTPTFFPTPGSSSFPKQSIGRGRKPKGKEKASKGAVPEAVQLIDHLPEANEDALQTFVPIDENWYQNKLIGFTKQLEDTMLCDCVWTPGDDPAIACSELSGCINYLTQIECLQDECRCRQMCQNQRFQKRQYAPIEIVLTEKKGFGMRLKEDVPMDTFVYEYLGEVVGAKAFQRRMKDYADEGLRHFYFMELQRDEYIDATKKGGFGRFLNHSCNPNCYIGKWVVGRQLRMGIFTKRAVRRGEELTFNYNVDRYGHEPQECYCGEPNCVGFLGGKTQTDVGAMDELYIDALGIIEDVENLTLKGSNTKRSKRMDIDYMPVMKAIPLKDVPKVASAIRQSISNKRILSKLLRRIMITEDGAVQKQLMRLHGFSMMSMVLNEYFEDEAIIETTLEILLKWPLITKNKLVSTNIEETVMKLSSNPSQMIQTLADELVKMWVTLEVSYRIPREKKQRGGNVECAKRKAEGLLDEIFSKRLRDGASQQASAGMKLVSDRMFIRPEAARRVNAHEVKPENVKLPADWMYEKTPDGRAYYYHVHTRQTQWTVPTPADVARVERELAESYARQKAAANDVEDIVAKAKAEEEALQAEALARKVLEEEENEKMQSLKQARREKHLHKQLAHQRKKDRDRSCTGVKSSLESSQGDQHVKDRRMLKLFSTVVVQTMSRYKDLLEHEQFKKRAKELTNILCQKESKSARYPAETYDRLTAEKEMKIKTFAKDWMEKLLARKGIPIQSTNNSTGQSRSMIGRTTSGGALLVSNGAGGGGSVESTPVSRGTVDDGVQVLSGCESDGTC